MAGADKAPGAFLTIGELSAELGVAQHILRYWETRFPQLRPLQRAGNRRYYRSEDVALARRIKRLLDEEGYTVRGVQKLLAAKGAATVPDQGTPPSERPARVDPPRPAIDVERLSAIRDRLAAALQS